MCKLRRSETCKTTRLASKALALLQRKVVPSDALKDTRRYYLGLYFLHLSATHCWQSYLYWKLLEYRYDCEEPARLFRARTEIVLQCATSLGKVQLEHLKLETLRQEHRATDNEVRAVLKAGL